MQKNSLTLKIFALIVLNDVIDTVAQFFMKKGLLATGCTAVTFDTFHSFVSQALSSGYLWFGVTVFMLNFFVWIIVLYKVDLSVAMPVGSTSYVFVPIVAMLFLREQVSVLRWLGIAAIVMGIHFVSQSGKEPGVSVGGQA